MSMIPRLCILACNNFQSEIAAAIAAEGWDDVSSLGFPARCGRPPLSWEELRPLLPADCSRVLILGRACLHGLDQAPAEFPDARLAPVSQCFHLVAATDLVDEAISAGAYLMTPPWLSNWRERIAELGFSPEQAAEFFPDFARELVLLDTRLDPETRLRLEEFRTVVKLPARRLAVGLDAVRSRLARLVLEWRLEEERRADQERGRRHAGELADHVAAMDLLARLARTRDEYEAIEAIEDLFRMLFAPAELHYLRLEQGLAIPRAPIPEALATAMRQLAGDHAWTPDGAGFLLRISHAETALGIIAADRLAYPEQRRRYLNLALAVSGVCGLAIDNARNRKRLLEAEKMASLGILVAGVAHEINTPLGVGLAAADALRTQARELAQRFAARAMTQTDLSRFLASAEQGGQLLGRNLERIAHLIDAFRQVAVAGKALELREFRLCDALEEVVRSLGDRLPADRITLRIECDPELTLRSYPDDWASIFLNLIGNSLKHGFKGRERGNIELRITQAAGRLRVDYRDDGAGLSPEVRARVFDPFFTTDLQQGMGLGMHLVFNLVTHRLGGAIQCESEPGQGARFVIDAPCDPEKEAR